jgi:Zn-dependent peptidase ImmA (M78 family)
MRSRSEIEREVDRLHKKYGATGGPVEVRRIAEGEGLPIVEMKMTADVSGALIKNKEMSGIALNAAHHPNRQRFTIAHELAHHALGHKGEDHIDWHFTVIRRDGTSSDATDAQEIEANFFAASLLMPKSTLREDVQKAMRFNGEAEFDDAFLVSLANKYQVSESAMRYRLINIGLLSPI